MNSITQGAPAAGGRVSPELTSRVRDKARGNWFYVAQACGLSAELLVGQRAACDCGGWIKFLDVSGRGTFVCRASGRADAEGDGLGLVSHVLNLPHSDSVRLVAEKVSVRETTATGVRRELVDIGMGAGR